MKKSTSYLKLHDDIYSNLRAENKNSWSQKKKLLQRQYLYNNLIQTHFLTQKQLSILILGCGDGETVLDLASYGHRVTGLDISPTALSWASEKALQRKLECHFLELDITKPINLSKRFDLIIDDHCFHCIIGNDRNMFLKNIMLHLKISGLVFFKTYCNNPPPHSAKTLQGWDIKTRCQISNSGVPGRYFGMEDEIIDEIKNHNFNIKSKKKILYPDGWDGLEVLAHL